MVEDFLASRIKYESVAGGVSGMQKEGLKHDGNLHLYGIKNVKHLQLLLTDSNSIAWSSFWWLALLRTTWSTHYSGMPS